MIRTEQQLDKSVLKLTWITGICVESISQVKVESKVSERRQKALPKPSKT